MGKHFSLKLKCKLEKPWLKLHRWKIYRLWRFLNDPADPFSDCNGKYLKNKRRVTTQKIVDTFRFLQVIFLHRAAYLNAKALHEITVWIHRFAKEEGRLVVSLKSNRIKLSGFGSRYLFQLTINSEQKTISVELLRGKKSLRKIHGLLSFWANS